MTTNGLLFKPAPSFDEPIEMLRACHERIRAQCATLEKLAAYLPSHGADEQAQQAAANIMRYFDVAGPHHHADEEQDLFPMLIEVGRTQRSMSTEWIATLLDEHGTLESEWARLREVLADIAGGHARPLERLRVAGFVYAYRSHIAREETHVFPFADACLSAQQLARLSAAMVARRTVAVPSTR